METIDIAPLAGALLGSLRGFSYSTEATRADLVDNSLSVGARLIQLSIYLNDGDPIIGILDDGARDHRKEEELTWLGWRVLTVLECDLERDPDRVVDGTRTLLRGNC